MALTNSSKRPPFQDLSQLSADAVSFIPGQLGQPLAFGNPEERAGITLVPQTASHMPTYVMNCYPFTDMDPNSRFQASAVRFPSYHSDVQSKPLNGHVSGFLQQKTHMINEGNTLHLDVQSPPTVNATLMAPSFMPAQVLNPSSLQVPVLNHIPPQARVTSSYLQGPTVGSICHQGYLGIPPTILSFNQPFQYGMQVPGYMYSPSSQSQGVWLTANQAKSEDKTLKSQAKTKVIVCKDNFSQTDFSDELAQLTLAEKPNTLYLKEIISQDADSDSGYSSPLHRKNQMSCGVKSSAYTSTFRPPLATSLLHPTNNIIPQTPSQSNIFSPVRGPVLPFMLPMTYSVPQFPGIGYPSALPFLHSKRSLPIQNQVETSSKRFPNSTNVNSHRLQFHGRHQQELFSAGPQISAEISTLKSLPTSVVEFPSGVEQSELDMACPHLSSNASSGDHDVRLPFEDEDEFPILLSAAGGLVAQGECFRPSSIAYGEILRNPSAQPVSRSRRSSASSSDKRRSTSSLASNGTPGALVTGLTMSKDSKSARKKHKRQMLAYQAAEEELAEISLEQQMLKELSTKQQKRLLFSMTDRAPKLVPTPCPPVSEATHSVSLNVEVSESTSAPSVFNIVDVTGQLENTKAEEASETVLSAQDTSNLAVPLDSISNTKRGKEFPNKKKPSSLKRVILKEREAKNRHSLLDDCSSLLPDGTVAVVTDDVSQAEGGGLMESMPPQVPTSAEMSPVSQMSPINMSPLSGSPAGSAGASPIAGDGTLGSGKSSVVSKIHSRRFREYCNQVLDKEIDDCCTELLQDLVRFQDCLYHDDPTKAKSKRRFVLGLREVTKHLKLGKLKCIIISPNLERIQSKGGLDEALNTIIEISQKQDVPFVFALGRRALGRACAKLVPVSVVGVFSYEGSEENFFKLRDLTQKAREAYAEMVASLEREMAATEPPATNTINTTAGSFEKLFPHLGHSRTPSACSAISFISSILSEPISENYPQSEPETDSRGYEIRHENRKPDLDTVGEGREEAVEPDTEDKKTALDEDIDDGHEADTEEDGMYVRQSFVDTATASARELKEKSKLVDEPESHLNSELLTKPDPATTISSANVNKSDASCCLLMTSVLEPSSGDLSVKGSIKVSVQGAMSTSERSERIESWVAESQRVTKQLRELSSESSSSAVNVDEESGDEEQEEEEEEEEGDNMEDVDDAASLKTIEDSSISEYEETTDVPFATA